MDENRKTPPTRAETADDAAPPEDGGAVQTAAGSGDSSPGAGEKPLGGEAESGGSGAEGAAGAAGPDLDRAASVVESLLLVSTQPLPLEKIGQILGGISRQQVRAVVARLRTKYPPDSSGILVEEIARGLQLRTNPANQEHVRKLFEAKPPRFTRPALETLAVIAYRQPVTRAEIEQIRGVDCAASLKTLMERRLVKVVGKKDVAGRPFLFGTTREFLEVFGLASLSDLPSMRDIEEFLAARTGAVVPEEPARTELFAESARGETSELARELMEAEHGEPFLVPSRDIPAGISDDALGEGAALADGGDLASITEGEAGASNVEEVVGRRRGERSPEGAGDRFARGGEAGEGHPEEEGPAPLLGDVSGFQEGVTDEDPGEPEGPRNPSGTDEK